jgi:hypothetical protein
MWFQVILIVALIGTAVYLVRSSPSAKHLAVRRLLVLLTLASGVALVLWPGLLSWVASLVGIGRGADLLFYLAIVAGLIYVVNEYKRSVQLARANTQLAREITLTEAHLTDRIVALEALIGEESAR